MAQDDDPGADAPFIFILVGSVRRAGEDEMTPFNALLSAPDDDSAVRRCLEALAAEGYEEADLDQIGTIAEPEEDDPYADPYATAMSGEIALIVYDRDSRG